LQWHFQSAVLTVAALASAANLALVTVITALLFGAAEFRIERAHR